MRNRFRRRAEPEEHRLSRRTDQQAATPIERRLGALVRQARGLDLWERLWRGLIPPLVVAGVFLAVSWLGLWLAVPHWARALGLLVFAGALAVSTFGLWRLTPLSRADALRRVDRASGAPHRPAAALDDRLAAAGRDPATDALWALHRKRAEAEAARLTAGRPSPRAVDFDRYAVRFGIVLALVACGIVAGSQRYARVTAAFDLGGVAPAGSSYRIDAWIDPPPYTGVPPVVLDLADDHARDASHPQRLSVPAGSTVVVRSSGGSPVEIETTGPLLAPVKTAKPDGKANEGKAADGKPSGSEQAKAPAAQPAPGDSETRLVLHGDSRLVLRHGGNLRGIVDLVAVPDRPPTIALREVPKRNARGSLTLAYTVGDDYGVSSAEARFTAPKIDGVPASAAPLVEGPVVTLSLPGLSHGLGDGETTADLAESPWAGASATMTLVAKDEGGNEGRSEPVEITLPEKPFTNPVARALVEQRRNLVLNPGERNKVAAALDAMMIEPAAVGESAGVYLGLRFAADTLAQAQTAPQLVAVADYLWGMANQIENGDLSEAEKALRDAEKALRDAIDRKASPEEVAKLTEQLQAAMDKFLKELAQGDKKGDRQQAQNNHNAKSISKSDLQKLIERLKEQARSGNREEARKALDELQDILENLKTAKQQKPDPQARAMAEGLNQLDQMMRDQQELRDETFKKGQGREQQSNQDGGEDGEPQPGVGGSQGLRPGKGGQSQGQGRQGGGKQPGSQGGGGEGGKNGKSLGQRQKELRDRLADIQKKLKQAGENQSALGDAGDDMREAEDALKQGGEGQSGQAVDAQGRALDALGKGAKKLAEAMQKQGNGDQPGGEGGGEQAGSQSSEEGQQTGDADPLGRPRGGNNTLNSNSRFDPMGIPAAQRAQRVLEELRRRLSDPSRAQDEIDYLERLLRSY